MHVLDAAARRDVALPARAAPVLVPSPLPYDSPNTLPSTIHQVDSDDSAYAGNKHVPGEDPITALGKNFPVVV